MNAMLLLVQRLSCDVEELIYSEVSLAIEKPEAYFEKFKDRLDERGIDSPIDQLAWFSLVDALLDHDLAFEIDWKESGLYLCDVVDELLDRKKMACISWEEFEDGEFDELPTSQYLNEISKKLKDKGISLACLDMESDCYVLITVPSTDINEIKELAREAGYRIQDSFEVEDETELR
ncbi:DUF6630 family protein [Paenibacillus popilliae]|uniref:DUF6630 domain-containing protein n=1 Tax=Paenibacillus popilliae TaxID=78057 RepID=A0ABY3AIS7_PAEPP|nr:DUF6630 family protein [Paenibacillus sp. SDF0028]TQR39924.1 hypothetical protein C7Y44_28585 [Paenibacillus sp. SDF0028]TQR41708.1 hypothetical protein C7Y44_24590 [Paenibacillus sp. SDF0028]